MLLLLGLGQAWSSFGSRRSSPPYWPVSTLCFLFDCLPQRRAPSAALRPCAVGLGSALRWAPWLHHVTLYFIVASVLSLRCLWRPLPPRSCGTYVRAPWAKTQLVFALMSVSPVLLLRSSCPHRVHDNMLISTSVVASRRPAGGNRDRRGCSEESDAR